MQEIEHVSRETRQSLCIRLSLYGVRTASVHTCCHARSRFCLPAWSRMAGAATGTSSGAVLTISGRAARTKG